jgi:hypothetical protein
VGLAAEGNDMSLYAVSFDGETEYVEAVSFGDAVAAWLKKKRTDWGEDDVDEQPESCTLLSDRPVIRQEG